MELIPTFVHKYSPSFVDPPTSHRYSRALKNWLLQFDSAKTLDTIVGCSFTYKVLEEQSDCKNVSIICKFTKESELERFEKLYYDDFLQKRLDQYFTKPDLLLEFGVENRNTNDEIKLEVQLAQKRTYTSERYDAR